MLFYYTIYYINTVSKVWNNFWRAKKVEKSVKFKRGSFRSQSYRMRHFWVEIEKAFASKAFSFPVSTFSISLVVSSHVFPFVVKINRIMLNFSQDDRETKKVCGELLLRWPTFESPFYLWSSSHWGKSRIFVQKIDFWWKLPITLIWIFAPKIILKKWNIWIFALKIHEIL